MKNKYSVSIAGSTLNILTDESEDYVKSLAQILDRRVMDMVLVKNKCSKSEALMLLALDYLDMSVKLKEELAELKEKCDEKK